jgi:hypothetical protein
MNLSSIWQKLRGGKDRPDTTKTAGVQGAEDDRAEMKTEVLQKHVEERDDPKGPGPPEPPTESV